MSLFFESIDKTKCNYFIIRVRDKVSLRLKEKHAKNTVLQAYDAKKSNHISLEDIADISGEKLCKTIDKSYMMDAIAESDYVLMSTSINMNKTRSKQLSKKLCGLVLLKKYREHLYVTLICGLPGLGGKLLKIIERIALNDNISKIKLDSVDAPIYFYLKNGFTFDRGLDTYEISENYREHIRFPKKIANPPPNYDKKNKKIDIGYIHSESRGS